MESTELSDLGFARAIQQYRDFVDSGWVDIIADLGLLNEIVEARGCYLVDQSGRKYLDFIAGFGAAILGHNHPDLGHAIVSAIGSGAPSLQPLGVSRSNAMLAEKLCALTGKELNKVHFASTGAEAIEHAMRVAMVVTSRTQFVSWKGAYHGLTLGALGLADADSPWRAPLEDWGTSSIAAELTDLEETRALLQTQRVAAIVIEVVQGIGGCRVYERLRSLQDLCTEFGTLLIVDEVLTGLGRTGTWFACQNVQEPCTPDMVVISKGLSCGVTPMSAVLLREDVWDCHAQACGPGLSHSSTLAGNLLSVGVALASLATLERCDVLRNARESGDLLAAGLNTLRKQPIGVGDVCGKGLLLSFTIEDHGKSTPETAARCWRRLLQRGILTSIAAHSPAHIKLTPPLIIGRPEIEAFVEALGDSMAEA